MTEGDTRAAGADAPDDEWGRILARVESGEASTGELLERVYAELRTMASRLMTSERDHHTLQPTALVHEAFMRLVASPSGTAPGRVEFLAAAACAMRRVLVDHARGRDAQKRGGAWRRVTLMGLSGDDAPAEDLDVVRLDAALTKLSSLDPRQARIVELRFFSGMAGQEIGEHLGVSRNTVVRELAMARAWLLRELSRES